MATRNYLYYDLTNSICSQCLRKVEAKIIFQEDKVYMLKQCPEHGREKVLLSTDIDYYKKCRELIKPGDMPKRFNTSFQKGCPYDCGLCPDHEQHSCVSLIEVTERCNLSCPVCYAQSGPDHGQHRSLDEIEKMLDIIVANEGEPDVVQISGGEPTLHPQFFEILDLAKQKPIRHLMVNTNGLSIAQDRAFAEKLIRYQPAFEIYLQFDTFTAQGWQDLRGADLSNLKAKAINILNELNLSTTLVVTLKKGVNTQEIGQLIEFALQQRCIRGITFQPIQVAGRLTHFDSTHRITLSEVREAILTQSSLFSSQDLIPVPCHPDAIVMGYALKLGSEVLPLTRFFVPEELLLMSGNTINFEHIPEIKQKVYQLFSTSTSLETASKELQSLMCCLPKIDVPPLKYENLFRLIVMQFYDIYHFDVRGVKKACVHIVHPDGRIIPFDTMNLFHRNNSGE